MRERVSFCVLEYMYRAASNWKTCGAALLQGRAGAYEATIRSCLDPGELFVPEQLLLSGPHRRHWEYYGDGTIDLDHAFHEFRGLRDNISSAQFGHCVLPGKQNESIGKSMCSDA